MQDDMPRRVVAEFFGTFWLVFGGCGSAVLAAGFPNLGIGFLGVSFAFGLTVLTRRRGPATARTVLGNLMNPRGSKTPAT